MKSFVVCFAVYVAVVSSNVIDLEDLTELSDKDLDTELSNITPLSDKLTRNKRSEDLIKFLIDSVADDIDKCGSPLQVADNQVIVSVKSLTCIVQALVDSLNEGGGLLKKIFDHILTKRDLAVVEPNAQKLTRAEQQCAMKAIIKETIHVLKEQKKQQKESKRRHKRRTRVNSSSNRCAKIESEIRESMQQVNTKKN